MSISGRIFAALYDRMMEGTEKAGLRAHRQALLAGAHGRVLEIGGGTGANLPFYPDQVQRLTVTEPEAPMAKRLARHLNERELPAELVQAPAEELPFEDGSFDVAVSTLVLCTVRDPERSLAELRRVLTPGGRLLFIEHVRSEEPRLARWQDRVNGLHKRVGQGCNCNRPTLEKIRTAGFAVTDLANDRLAKAPPWVRPLIIGTATANGAAGAP